MSDEIKSDEAVARDIVNFIIAKHPKAAADINDGILLRGFMMLASDAAFAHERAKKQVDRGSGAKLDELLKAVDALTTQWRKNEGIEESLLERLNEAEFAYVTSLVQSAEEIKP